MLLSWKLLIRLGGAISLVGGTIVAFNISNRGLARLGDLVGFAGILLIIFAANKRRLLSASSDSSAMATTSPPQSRGVYYLLGGAGGLVVTAAIGYLGWKSGVGLTLSLLYGTPILVAYCVMMLFFLKKRS